MSENQNNPKSIGSLALGKNYNYLMRQRANYFLANGFILFTPIVKGAKVRVS